MKKILGVCFVLFFLVACSSQSYDLASKPVVTFKTSLGEFSLQFYKDVAPKTAEAFLSLIQEKKYHETGVDEVMLLTPYFNIGFNSKVLSNDIKGDFFSEIAPKEGKNLEKGELFFSAKNEGFGAFSVYCGDSAMELKENANDLIIFGKVVEGHNVLDKIMETPTGQDFKPNEKIEILETLVNE